MPDAVVWNYRPTTRQEQAHKAKERFKLYGGAMGGGKTVWLCAEVIYLSMEYPGNRIYLCRQHLIDLKHSTLVTFENLCPDGVILRHILDDREIEFWNGSRVLYGGLGTQEELERIKSTEFGAFAVDECTETYEEMFALLASRLRWKLKDGSLPPYHGLLASNPEPGWVKRRFVDQKLDDHVFIPALPRDNPHLPVNYTDNLKTIFDPDSAKRYLDGSWDIFEGQVYKEFSRSRHVYANDIFEHTDSAHFDLFRVIDHGYRNPTCCLWGAVDFDGRIWIYDEYYQAERTIEENAQTIISKSAHGESTTICDPSMFSRSMQKYGRPWSPVDEYRENGVICIAPYNIPGAIPEINGINMVKSRLKNNSLFIHESCVNLITEIVNYKWKKLRLSEGGRNNPERPTDYKNHAVDALRYLCMWRPAGSSKPQKPLPLDSIHYAILRHKKELSGPFYAGWN